MCKVGRGGSSVSGVKKCAKACVHVNYVCRVVSISRLVCNISLSVQSLVVCWRKHETKCKALLCSGKAMDNAIENDCAESDHVQKVRILPALTVTALTNCSLQLLLPTTKAKFAFLISLSTVFYIK